MFDNKLLMSKSGEAEVVKHLLRYLKAYPGIQTPIKLKKKIIKTMFKTLYFLPRGFKVCIFFFMPRVSHHVVDPGG